VKREGSISIAAGKRKSASGMDDQVEEETEEKVNEDQETNEEEQGDGRTNQQECSDNDVDQGQHEEEEEGGKIERRKAKARHSATGCSLSAYINFLSFSCRRRISSILTRMMSTFWKASGIIL